MTCMEVGELQRANYRFVKQAMTLPLLAQEREFELARKWRENEDETALHELTEAYMRLVISLASRFRTYGLPTSDLIQEGHVGLMQAAARFEPEREIRFSTYASWWIRAAIQDYILRNWSIVRTGTTVAHKSLFFNLRRLRGLIDNGASASMSPADKERIAEMLGVTIGDVDTMEGRLSGGDHSLNVPLSQEEGGAEWQDLLPCTRPLPEDETIESHDGACRSRWIEEALQALNSRELTVIKARRLTDEVATLESLGLRLGISKERVRQIEHHALKKMRASLLDRFPDPYEMGFLG